MQLSSITGNHSNVRLAGGVCSWYVNCKKMNFLVDSSLLFPSFRATSALRLKFEVCKELGNHLELLPKTAYIQAESQFAAQLKFLPR